MEKTFVLDTNVILFDPMVIYRFGNNIVFIPLVVIEELDNFKRDQNENGRNARSFARIIDKLRQSGGQLSKGIKLPHGGSVVISVDSNCTNKSEHAKLLDLNHVDNRILSSALGLKEKEKDVILITKDINLRLKSDILGVPAEDYGPKDSKKLDELYSGQRKIELPQKCLTEFEQERFLPFDKTPLSQSPPNEYLIIYEKNNQHRRILGRYCQKKQGLVPLIPMQEGVWGIYPKNIEQQFALDALLNNQIKLVSLLGKAGTGKTLLAIAAGLEQTVTQEKYRRLLVSRPTQPMGRDIGYLPGDINEKLSPWMQPIFDNIDLIFGKKKNTGRSPYDKLMEQGILHIEPLTYIRGRSIPEQYLIIDEAQNLSPHEVKTIITRAGEGTKIVLTGDCEQIDNPYLDSVNNGLIYCVERLKIDPMIAHATLNIGERSPLSELASKLL